MINLSLDDNTADIRFCAELEIQNMLGSNTIKEDIVNQVVERAEENFLWVGLATKQLRHCHSLEAVQDILLSLPSGMDALYERMEANISRLTRTVDKELSCIILTWVMFARRPLTKLELLSVMAPNYSEPLDFGHMISKTCGQFVTLDTNGKVILIYQTAREYREKAERLPFSLKPSAGHRNHIHKDHFAVPRYIDTLKITKKEYATLLSLRSNFMALPSLLYLKRLGPDYG